eukprot:1193611-Prorocentrum_minimum.AAC.2
MPQACSVRGYTATHPRCGYAAKQATHLLVLALTLKVHVVDARARSLLHLVAKVHRHGRRIFQPICGQNCNSGVEAGNSSQNRTLRSGVRGRVQFPSRLANITLPLTKAG